jgi:hypothetical protein
VEGLERLHELSHGLRYGIRDEVVDENGETACLASGRSNGKDGLVAEPKGKTREAALSSSKFGETWQ